MISLKKKLVVYCVDLNLIRLKNTKYWLDHIIKNDDAFCLYGYLFRQDEREISSLMITLLCILKKNIADSINNEAIIQQFQNMKNLQKEILKLYVFATSFLCQCIQVLFLLNFVKFKFLNKHPTQNF